MVAVLREEDESGGLSEGSDSSGVELAVLPVFGQAVVAHAPRGARVVVQLSAAVAVHLALVLTAVRSTFAL